MRISDTADAISRDMYTLTEEGFFNTGRFGGVDFNEVRRGQFAGHIAWKNKEPYLFGIRAEVKKFGIVEFTFQVLPNFEYFDRSLVNSHKFVLVYTDVDADNTDVLRKTLRAIANLTAAQAELNI